ncbi:MAG: hypothetical protein J2P57_24120, partial [Acidimicrobiaceae bacterium]|nr:hypothetical protein [Acidimicrobiaceae bacterium]
MTGNPLHADARAHFMASMGLEHEVDDDSGWGRVTMGPYLQTGASWPSVAALLTFADVLIGRLASQRTAPRISVTANLGVRMVAPLPDDGRLEMAATIVKTGRTMTVGETTFSAAGTGVVVASSLGTFLASPRPQDVAPDGLRDGNFFDAPGPVAPTLAGQVGLEVVSPGVTTVAL